jgi:deoxyinosine 3'endonuclease (endonuclease V)
LMQERNILRELRAKELATLRERVAKRIKIKPLAKRVRRIAGVDLVITPQASKVHVCACLMSLPKLEVLEEAIATDEIEISVYRDLGNIVIVPLVLSVLKMLKHNIDVIAVREGGPGDAIPLAAYVGVISGKPAFGVSERASSLKKFGPWEGARRAASVKLRGQKTAIGVVAGHHMSSKDAVALARASAKVTRIPEPVRNAGSRVRAWEREWRRVNPKRR